MPWSVTRIGFCRIHADERKPMAGCATHTSSERKGARVCASPPRRMVRMMRRLRIQSWVIPIRAGFGPPLILDELGFIGPADLRNALPILADTHDQILTPG